MTVHYITGTYFFSRWPEFTIRYVLKNFEGLEQDEDLNKNLNGFGFPTSYGYT
jgi:hypothetical protein